MAFLESKYWTDTKDFIVNKVVPMLVDFYENILKPIGIVIKDSFLATWETISTLFSDLGDAFDLFASGDWWGGITKIFTSIGTFLGDMLDNVLTAVWNTIAVVFGLSKTDSVFGSIWGFFTDTYDEIVSWIKITWFNIKTTISETWTSIKDSVVKVFTDVKDWFVGLFTWASDVVVGTWTSVKDWMQGVWDGVWGWFTKAWTWTSDVAVGTWTTVTNFITGVWDSVVGWFKGLWAWGKAAGATEEGGFSLKKFVDAAFTKAKDWVVSLFTWATAPVGPNDSWIAKTIKDAIALVKTWALSLFAWAETPGGSWISIKVKEVIKLVKEWVVGLFTWVSEAGKVDGKEWSLTTMISAAVEKVIGWVKGIFKWTKKKGTTEEGDFSITKLISGLWKDITQALSDIFPSLDDLKAMLPKLSDVTDTIKGWFGFGSDEKGKGKNVNTGATGGPMAANQPMLVGELGPELILPSSGGQVVNAERTSQIQAAGLRRGAGSGGGAPALVNAPVNTINNSQSNTTVTSTELKHPSAILNRVNLAA